MPRAQRGIPAKRKLVGVNQVLVVSSGKGGVGKSSVAASSGNRLRVGLLDLDIFGPSIPKLMGLEGLGEPILTQDNRLTPMRAHGIPCMSMGFLLPNSASTTSDPEDPDADHGADTPVVWRGMMVMKAVQQLLFEVDWRAGTGGHDLDVLVVDTPPGTGDVTLSLGQLVQVDGRSWTSPAELAVGTLLTKRRCVYYDTTGSVIVSTPQNVAIVDTRKGVAMFRKVGIPITGAVLNMAHFICPGSSTRHHIFGRPETFERVCAKLGIDMLAEIPLEADVSEQGDLGRPVVLSRPSSTSTIGGLEPIRGVDTSTSCTPESPREFPAPSAPIQGPTTPSVDASSSHNQASKRDVADPQGDVDDRNIASMHHDDAALNSVIGDNSSAAAQAFQKLAIQVWSRLVSSSGRS
ncbi:BZ3500_MvSof-1268-A1-R1_Chr1-3g01825 [Microbotryum saponariae]|uniref:BZ3500_MvSof-1268-A1-R1_Chr1-3g01825 protein n=1 Tax=Microbotryum saponariae TaxID=289078 RepID=A0A2X0KM03_9BASI|nr:BZ3500_MvSof-1268-A1-R1_Chr1-3g01825 [Microbotryum saponariae]SCZ94679.1 BZ3501_MvSof-1269-A2-R1_Chr1-3g01427 [Microbotryum saponariae]